MPPLLALLLLALPADGAADGGAARGSAPSWVESSAGLVPPTLEGGRTEVEMGDVNGDGLLDLVSVGDHGSPFVNTDQHGVMVWLGDGEGGWSVRMHGDFGYGGVALGDVDGDGLVDFADILAVLGSWGPCEGDCPADLDGDGVVGFADLLLVLANWT